MMDAIGRRVKRVSGRFRWAVVVVGVLILGAIISICLFPGSDSHLKALRDAGLPTSLEELNRWLPQVPASNNAALVIMAAVDKRVTASPELDNLLPLLSLNTELGEEKDEFEQYIQRNSEALQLIHRAAVLPSARYALNLTNPFAVPHLAELKALANLLKAEAIYYSHNDRPDLAFRSVTSGFALARTLRQEPALISELVRIALVAIALHNFESLLAAQKLSPDHLVSANNFLALAEADANQGAFHAIVSERAIVLDYFNLPAREFIKVFNTTGGPFMEWFKVTAYRVLNIRRRDQRLFLEMMDGLSRAATNSYPDALRIGGEVDREIDRRLASGFGRFVMVTPMTHSMQKVMEKEAAILTRLRCARTAIAVERYRRDHEGSLPESLDELVPTYLSEIPRDPAVGESLQMEHTKTAYLISSPAAAARLKNPRTATFRVPK